MLYRSLLLLTKKPEVTASMVMYYHLKKMYLVRSKMVASLGSYLSHCFVVKMDTPYILSTNNGFCLVSCLCDVFRGGGGGERLPLLGFVEERK